VGTLSSVELEQTARQLAGDRFDDYAVRGFRRAYDEYVGRRRRSVSAVTVIADGRAYPSLYAGILDPGTKFTTGELRLEGPSASPDSWEFLAPFSKIVFQADGAAELHGPDHGPPRRAIARFLLREHYLVRSRTDDAPGGPGGPRFPSLVGTLPEGVAICRSAPLLPFEAAILLYLADGRARFEIDLVHSVLLCDPRAGRLAAARRVSRPSRLSWGLDQKIGRGHLSLLAARCLELLVESNGLSSIDLSHVFGGVREIVDSALQALVQQRYASFDPRTGLYRARLEAFLPESQVPAPVAEAPVRPELRTGVQELIAAADARATCPLCGKPRPMGPHTSLLCDECAEKVGIG